MLAVIPIAVPEIQRALDLLAWMKELGGCANHRAVLVVSHPMQQSDAQRLVTAAKGVFGKVSGIRQRQQEEMRWPLNANAMFREGAEYVATRIKEPFLWLECDAIPVRKGWLDAIEAEYLKCGKPIMGTVYDIPERHINGVAVWPANLDRVNHHMLNGMARPFDLCRPDITLARAAVTPLIHRSLADPRANRPHTFTNLGALSAIPEACALFHGCKDGTLIARLREKRNPPKVKVQKEGFKTALENYFRRVRRLRYGSSYYHSGNLGDIIYGLYAIKLHGGGKLVIGPEQRDTSPCAVPIAISQFNAVLPLLRDQSYLCEVEFAPNYPADIYYDLNTFRNHWNNWPLRQQTKIHTLCKMHCHTLGVGHLFREDRAWLECSDPMRNDWLVVQRSPRYHAESHVFPWQEMARRYGDKMLFVGLETEWRAFEKLVGRGIRFWGVVNLLEMARIIAGARCVMMNQSFPLSVAIGLDVPAVVEEWPPSPDCRFKRPNYCGHLGRTFDQICKFVEERL